MDLVTIQFLSKVTTKKYENRTMTDIKIADKNLRWE